MTTSLCFPDPVWAASCPRRVLLPLPLPFSPQANIPEFSRTHIPPGLPHTPPIAPSSISHLSRCHWTMQNNLLPSLGSSPREPTCLTAFPGWPRASSRAASPKQTLSPPLPNLLLSRPPGSIPLQDSVLEPRSYLGFMPALHPSSSRCPGPQTLAMEWLCPHPLVLFPLRHTGGPHCL